jgi:hypothetical protein
MTPLPFRIVALIQSPDAVFHPHLALVHGIEDGRLVYDPGHPRDLVAFAEVSGALVGHTATLCGEVIHGSLASAREALRRSSARFVAGGHDIAVIAGEDSFTIREPVAHRERIG